MSPEPLLRLDDVSLSFAGVSAVIDTSFAVQRGEICALIGPNGAGKSSLLNVINGLYRPSSGRVIFDGEAHEHIDPNWAARHGVARTFQNIALFKRMSVADNLATGRSLSVRSSAFEQALRLPRFQRERRREREHVERVLEQLELGAWARVAVGQLPYGLQKRVELGRALVSEPRLLLLDEPLAGMNHEEKQEMRHYIEAANARGATVLFIEHDMGVVMDASHHVIVLDYGRKIADGTPERVRRDQRVIDAYLGVSNEPTEVAA